MSQEETFAVAKIADERGREVARLNGELDRAVDAIDSLEREVGRLKATIKRVKELLPGEGMSRADRGPYRVIEAKLIRAALEAAS